MVRLRGKGERVAERSLQSCTAGHCASRGREVWRGMVAFVLIWCVVVLILGSAGTKVQAQSCVPSPVENCSVYMATDALPCYCVDDNWFYEWTCCFPETPVFPMYQCWCQSNPTAAGIAVTSVIMSVFLIGAVLALIREWMRSKKRKAEDLENERVEAKDIEPEEYAAAMEAERRETNRNLADDIHSVSDLAHNLSQTKDTE